MKSRGAASIAIIVIIVIVAVILGAIFYYRHLAVAPTLSPTSGSTPTPAAGTFWLDPASGPVGTLVTIHGGGFGRDNAIGMNNLTSGTMRDVTSPDGETLSFQVPATLGPVCKSEICAQFLVNVTPGVYDISVTNSSTTQDIGNFTVTAQ